MDKVSRWFLSALGALVLSLVWVDAGIAQQVGTVTPPSMKELLAVLINTAGVMCVVQVIKFYLPYLTDKYGWVMPLIAMASGPVVAFLQGFLATKLGYPGFDFSLIVAALTGGTAVAAHQVYAQQKEGPTGIARGR